VVYSARNGQDHQQMHQELESAFEWLYTEDDDFRRAIEVQGLLVPGSIERYRCRIS